MEGSWWKDPNEMDKQQQKIVALPVEGNYLVQGPPGCGKTNLLILRMQWLSSAGKRNVLFLTLGRSLAEFIRTGVGAKKLIETSQIMTFAGWSKQIIADHMPSLLAGAPAEYDEARDYYADALNQATSGLPNDYYEAIAVDEIQDLKSLELEVLSRLTPRLIVAGDTRQKIYAGSGIAAAQDLNFTQSTLDFHYRIGHAICVVADKVYPPSEGDEPLLQKSQYPEGKMPSTARGIDCQDFNSQCEELVKNIKTQLKAYPGEGIGILLPTFKHGNLDTLRAHLDAADFANLVSYHDENGRSFETEKRIFVLTCHSAKGTEFRSVHLLAAERMIKGPLARRALIFTAVTRAKTSLTVYYSDSLPPSLASAFAKPTVPDLKNLFD
jgi:superfamily I DNA/RNA helicase